MRQFNVTEKAVNPWYDAKSQIWFKPKERIFVNENIDTENIQKYLDQGLIVEVGAKAPIKIEKKQTNILDGGTQITEVIEPMIKEKKTRRKKAE